ncbi:MAG: hypothetical protein LBQ61_02925, partial [Spirochaetales bacterium]|nr:hypothetical protein [Spirochaetales bacterium]
NQENYAEAYRLYKEYINIFPNLRDDLSEVNARLERRMAEENQEDSPASSDSPGPSRSGPAGLTSRELLNRAQESERQEDYFSAYYYSDLAFKQDSNFIDARDFASQMQAAIEHSAPPLEERVQARIFSDKKQGADFLTNGKPVDAYYTFLRLKIYLDTNNLPPDPDVELYITLAEEAAKEVSFYPEDVQFLESSPGYDGIFFLNRSSQEDPSLGESERELIFFEKAVPHYPAGESWMIRNGAVIRFDSQGIIYSLRADYGKILFKSPEESYLILRGIDGETRETFSDVRFLEGRNRPEIPYLIPLRISHNQLNLAAEETQDYRLTSLGWLLGARKLITDLGIFSWSLSRRIIEKLIFPFSFLVLSLFSLALGWRLRWRSGALAPAYWLIFPVLPFFFVRLMEFYRSAFLLITQFVLSWLGYLPALLLLLISQGALLVLAFIILAGQSGE